MLDEAGEGAHVAQVEAGVAAGQAAEVAGLVRLGRGHVVVDPHPPARVQRGQVLCSNSQHYSCPILATERPGPVWQ